VYHYFNAGVKSGPRRFILLYLKAQKDQFVQSDLTPPSVSIQSTSPSPVYFIESECLIAVSRIDVEMNDFTQPNTTTDDSQSNISSFPPKSIEGTPSTSSQDLEHNSGDVDSGIEELHALNTENILDDERKDFRC
jgi:hypothetical protein